MKETFVEYNFRPKSIELLEHCERIITDYQNQGLTLTLRQLYYQLVSANIIANKESSYKNLGSLVSRGRLAGILDWDAIEDRVRQPNKPSHWNGPRDIFNAAISGYRLDRWEGQTNFVELWVEKDALAGVLEPVAKKHHITLMVNRGYSSQSAMYDAARRIWQASECDEHHILYLGDLDPSGEDMVRDIDERLNDMFGAACKVEKLAITPEQVMEFNPPPQPAKTSDSRARRFIAEHGTESYEVDALPPVALREIINDALKDLVDHDPLHEILNQERRDISLMIEARDHIMTARQED